MPFNLFKGEGVKMEHINPSVFIPPVGLIVIPIMGGHFMASAQGPVYDALAIIMTAHYAARKGLPYTPSWWAFVFPLGAYTAATALIAKVIALHTIAYIHHAETALLLGLWAAVFIGNLRRAIRAVGIGG